LNKGALLDEIPRDITTSKSIRDAVVLTLATIAGLPPSPTCDSVATHLLPDPASFAALQGMVATSNALLALTALQVVVDAKRETASDSAPFLVVRAASVLESYGNDSRKGESNEQRKLSRHYSCLRRKSAVPSFRFNTFLSKEVDPCAAWRGYPQCLGLGRIKRPIHSIPSVIYLA
jgi:hypothetical protein